MLKEKQMLVKRKKRGASIDIERANKRETKTISSPTLYPLQILHPFFPSLASSFTLLNYYHQGHREIPCC